MSWTDLSPTQASELLAKDRSILVLDVRTAPEYERHHIEGASLIPVQVLDRYFDQLDKSRPWLIVCEHGRRSVSACEFLAQRGFTDLRNLTGGMAAWLASRLPVGTGLPQQAQPAPAPGGGTCGHSCGCAGRAGAAPQEASQAAEAADASKPAKKGWFRSLLGR